MNLILCVPKQRCCRGAIDLLALLALLASSALRLQPLALTRAERRWLFTVPHLLMCKGCLQSPPVVNYKTLLALLASIALRLPAVPAVYYKSLLSLLASSVHRLPAVPAVYYKSLLALLASSAVRLPTVPAVYYKRVLIVVQSTASSSRVYIVSFAVHYKRVSIGTSYLSFDTELVANSRRQAKRAL